MTTRSWFRFNGAMHVRKSDTHGLCGVQPLKMPASVGIPEGDVPDGYCRTCLLEVGKSWVEDEPMAEAKARGYYPADFPEDLQDS